MRAESGGLRVHGPAIGCYDGDRTAISRGAGAMAKATTDSFITELPLRATSAQDGSQRCSVGSRGKS